MIASITVANGYALVSNNLKHFDRVEGLKVERWLDN
jgi:predicted nucleic acid-binding protein